MIVPQDVLRPREVILVADGSPGLTEVFSTVTIAHGLAGSLATSKTWKILVALVASSDAGQVLATTAAAAMSWSLHVTPEEGGGTLLGSDDVANTLGTPLSTDALLSQ